MLTCSDCCYRMSLQQSDTSCKPKYCLHFKFLSNQYHIKDKSFISASCNKLFSKILEIFRNSRSGFSFRPREEKDANRSLSEALSSGLQVSDNFEQSSRKTSRGGGITIGCAGCAGSLGVKFCVFYFFHVKKQSRITMALLLDRLRA